MSNVLVRMGDIFEGSAQVTILPCSGKGTVSSAVQRWLTMFNIPSPKDIPFQPQFGDISELIPFKGEEHVTKYVVFAASVLNDFSSYKIIKKLAAKLGELTQTNSDIRLIETPLLGTGAGGLKTEVAGKALYQGFKSTAHPDSTFYIFVFDRERQTTLQTLFSNLEERQLHQINKRAMNNQQREHLDKLRQTYQKRLNVLELQAANFGISAPPHTLTEIEDIRDKIKSIETQLVELEQSAAQVPEQQTISITISILFLSADPTDASRLRLGEELREIQEKLQLAKLRERFVLHQRMSVRPADISQALLDEQPQIVHFSSHGTSTGALCFENQVGETHPIQPEALSALFEMFVNQVNCVLLNACFSEIQAEAIAQHIDYVIGMNQAIGDKAAIVFVIGFYQALGAGRSIEEAYKLGCVQIQLHNIPEHLTPVLIKKKV